MLSPSARSRGTSQGTPKLRVKFVVNLVRRYSLLVQKVQYSAVSRAGIAPGLARDSLPGDPREADAKLKRFCDARHQPLSDDRAGSRVADLPVARNQMQSREAKISFAECATLFRPTR